LLIGSVVLSLLLLGMHRVMGALVFAVLAIAGASWMQSSLSNASAASAPVPPSPTPPPLPLDVRLQLAFKGVDEAQRTRRRGRWARWGFLTVLVLLGSAFIVGHAKKESLSHGMKIVAGDIRRHLGQAFLELDPSQQGEIEIRAALMDADDLIEESQEERDDVEVAAATQIAQAGLSPEKPIVDQPVKLVSSKEPMRLEAGPFGTQADARRSLTTKAGRVLAETLIRSGRSDDVGTWIPAEAWTLKYGLTDVEIAAVPSSTEGVNVYMARGTLAKPDDDRIEQVWFEYLKDAKSQRSLSVLKIYAGSVCVLGGLAVFLRLGTGRHLVPGQVSLKRGWFGRRRGEQV
jgi:hypothetical protein